MITFDEALKTVTDLCIIKGTERISLNSSNSRILAEDIYADIDMPPFNKSMMDGYACMGNDVASPLELIEVIPAGKTPVNSILPGTCSKIMTGAPVPEGADLVVKIENTVINPEGKIVCSKNDIFSNIIKQGSDIKAGERIIKCPARIGPIEIAVLSSAGVTEPLVYQQPKVGFFCTGNEIVEPYLKPGLSQIRNSNAGQLHAQIIIAGAIPGYYGIIDDNPAAIKEAIDYAGSENDIVLISGGVSAGDFDYVPAAMKSAGYSILFDSIKVQPGKPLKFAIKGEKMCFGFPGNPVSSFVQFELLVKPLLKKMANDNSGTVITRHVLAESYKRRDAERQAFIPLRLNPDNTVTPADYHGSAHINSYLGAYGIASIPSGQFSIKKGEFIDVRQI